MRYYTKKTPRCPPTQAAARSEPRPTVNRGTLLYQLQTLDLDIENSTRRIAEIQDSLGETTALLQARQALSQAEQEHREWTTKINDLELEIGGLNAKIERSERRLYGGRITNPKELSDLQEEIASLKRRRTTIEDALLEAMVANEEAEATVEQCRQTLNETQTAWQADQSALRHELDELEARLTHTRAEREQIRQRIPPEDLSTYDHVRQRYGSVAVTQLNDGVCGFCAMAPSSDKLKRIRSGRELLQCSNCGRILVTP